LVWIWRKFLIEKSKQGKDVLERIMLSPSVYGTRGSVYDEDNAAMSTHEYKISIPTTNL
jgi:hypothetical protein